MTESLRASAQNGTGSARPRADEREIEQSQLVLLGEFGRAQGLGGEVRLKSHTGEPEAIASYGPLTAEDGRSIVISSIRRAAGDDPSMLVARVEGVGDRTSAETLNRIRVYAARDRLGRADEDEYFLADLIGSSAFAPDGTALGTVVDVPNYGGGDLLEIAPPSGPTRLVPFSKACVPFVDPTARRLTVLFPDETDANDVDEAS